MRVFVPGTPAPQGSKTRNRAGAVYESNRRTGPWRERVAMAVGDAMAGEPATRGAVAVNARFIFLRPTGHYGNVKCADCGGRGEVAGEHEHVPLVGTCSICDGAGRVPRLRPSAPRLPGKRPDIDKLLRAVLDACSGIVFADDAQVVRVNMGKEYGNAEGVELTVRVVG